MKTAKASPKKVKRIRAEPQWHWTGAPARPHLDHDGRVAATVAMLPGRRSPTEDIMARILGKKSKFRQYLRQDEFGPSQAERGAALSVLLKVLRVLLRALAKTPPRLQVLLAARLPDLKLSRDRKDGVEFEVFERERESLGRISDAAFFPVAEVLTASEFAHAERIRMLSEEAQTIWDALDAASALDVIYARYIFGEDQFPPVIEGSDDYMALRGRLVRLRTRVELTLRALNLRKGPDSRVTLGWIVEQSADLYTEETGEIVTSSPKKGGDYVGVPQSAAGKFVTAALEAMLPPQTWPGEDSSAVPTASVIFVAGSPGDRARAVNNMLANYVSRHPDPKRRGRRKKAARTI